METTLLPASNLLHLECITPTEDSLTLRLTSVRAAAHCPRCGRPSGRVQSRYERTVADLPWRAVAVRLRITARRFFCDNGPCERAIFAEPLPEVVARYARRTDRLADALLLIAHALGGEAGARLARELGLSVSPDTLLRRVCYAAPPAPEAAPRVLGVDDFAFARGRRYGTLLADLERRRPVDLPPDRQAGTLAEWLRAHPGVEVVSRDRAGAYADGARAGAPDAVQVADRWHLLKNLGDALERLLTREYPSVRQAAREAPLRADGPATEPAGAGRIAMNGHMNGHITEAAPQAALEAERDLPQAERDRQARRERRLGRYADVMALHRQGVSARAIATSLGLSRNTVRRLIRAPDFPEAMPRPRQPAGTDPFADHLRRRWGEGCHNAALLWRERRAEGLDGWLAAARRSGLPGLSGFARGVGQDKAAVAAALSSAWNNGKTEGQVNRLKLLKRQMYGRAGFALLRARVLASH